MGEKLLRSAENTGRVGAVAATLPRAAIEQPQAISPGEIQVAEELLKSQSCLESHMDAVHRERPCQQPQWEAVLGARQPCSELRQDCKRACGKGGHLNTALQNVLWETVCERKQ